MTAPRGHGHLALGTLTLIPAVSLVEAARGTPAIDGVEDAVWSRARRIATAVQLIGASGATAMARLLCWPR